MEKYLNKPWLDYQPDSNLLENRVLLITGAAHGLGRMAAYQYACYGATVILLDQDEKALESLYDRMVEQQLPEPVLVVEDLQTFGLTEADRLVKQITDHFGRLDGLLHSAGILGMLGPIEYIDPQLWQQTLQVNLNAAFMLIKVVLPVLKLAPDAAILLTSIAEQRIRKAYWNAYAVAAAGVDTLCHIVADELESVPGLCINTLDPGDINTRLFRQAFPGRELDDVALPDSLRMAYLYLMGPDSRHISGRKLSLQSE